MSQPGETKGSIWQHMLRTVGVMVPVVVPSWRFFDVIAPSPRLEYRWMQNRQDERQPWQEYRPRPASMSVRRMLWHLLWNPRWNEGLFMVSCMERWMESGDPVAWHEITTRLEQEVRAQRARASDMERDAEGQYWQFRIILIQREGEQLLRDVVVLSPVYGLATGGVA